MNLEILYVKMRELQYYEKRGVQGVCSNYHYLNDNDVNNLVKVLGIFDALDKNTQRKLHELAQRVFFGQCRVLPTTHTWLLDLVDFADFKAEKLEKEKYAREVLTGKRKQSA